LLGTVLEVVEAVDLAEVVVVVVIVVVVEVVVVGIVVEDVAAAVAAVGIVEVVVAVANATNATDLDTLHVIAMKKNVVIDATKLDILQGIAPTREPVLGVAVEAMGVAPSREVIEAVETATIVANLVTSAVTVIRNHNVQDEEAPRMTITKWKKNQVFIKSKTKINLRTTSIENQSSFRPPQFIPIQTNNNNKNKTKKTP